MSLQNFLAKFQRRREKWSGGTIEYDLARYREALEEIKKCKTPLAKRSDVELQELWQTLKNNIDAGRSFDRVLHQAFAVIGETVSRKLKLFPFDEQIIGALAMHEGRLAEMQTGEGKTLVAVFPAALNALSGKGVHVLTFNDYLAQRDAEWMGPVYRALGLKVSFVREGMSVQERQKAYQADITYLTAKEAGFDYLRDSLARTPDDVVHREFNFAIIDEADSILIDEARVPLVIAAAENDFLADVIQSRQIAQSLDQELHIEFDHDARNALLSESGINYVEKVLKCGSLYAEENAQQLARINCALHAEFLLQRDVDYILRDDKIELVDEFTGRIADKRRWPDGLQAALEAKENVAAQSRGKILNSITLRHFLRLYPNICGMTATAQIAEEEFREFYDLHTVVIPPHKPCIRNDRDDLLFQRKSDKQKALIEQIIRIHGTEQPILVGTRSVEESAELAKALQTRNVACEVLNAKNDAREAKIVAKAGKLGAVTISTNMAGRGTDILLGAGNALEKKKVEELGGLHVICANRHESLRIDNQLRGRAGRQGDPGSSQFIISLEDDLFQKYRLDELLPASEPEFSQDGHIESQLISEEIQRLQRIIETQHLEIKKTLFQYNELVERQRQIIFQRRLEILQNGADIDFYRSSSPEHFEHIREQTGEGDLRRACQKISLSCIDESWVHYLETISDIREGIHLNRLGGREPFFEFQKQVIALFKEMSLETERMKKRAFESIQIKNGELDLEAVGLKAPSATWTYLINDNPFKNELGLQLMGNIGAAAGAGLLGPLVALTAAYRRIRKKK